MNTLYYGNNLQILREDIKDESVDLIYLDPPFNSNANYNVLFKSPGGHKSHAQIEAFDDTWHWETGEAEQAFDEVMRSGNTDASELLRAMRAFLKENDMMAYLCMIAVRALELRRVLKPTGSIYFHCDPTASHYLKLLLDSIFQKNRFRNEIVWKRSSAHSDTKQGMRRCGKIHDVILFYTKTKDHTWCPEFTPYTNDYLASEYRHIMKPSKRLYKETDLTAAKPGGDVEYEWRIKRKTGQRWEADIEEEFRVPKPEYEYKAVKPYGGRFWAYSKSNLLQFAIDKHLIHRKTGMPRLVQFADEMPGIPLQDLWDDIPPNLGKEDLGYPTQKPRALLERIINLSSNKGETVLDPFCGCGTTIHAAQKLEREWIGIDITSLAIGLIEDRIRRAFPGVQFDVSGTPKDMDGARKLALKDKYQFQWWATRLIPGGVPFGSKKKGPDFGIDGLFYFKPDAKTTEKGIISVKGGENVGVTMIRDLAHVVKREKAQMGIFITLIEPTKPMLAEAVTEGFYDTAFGRFPRLQIITVDRLLKGEIPRLPPKDDSSFRQAQREDTSQQDALPF